MECLLDWKSEHHVSLAAQTERVSDERGEKFHPINSLMTIGMQKTNVGEKRRWGNVTKIFLHVEGKHNDVIGRK